MKRDSLDNRAECRAVLFDFDGVVLDTETQYSRFWHRIGTDYLGLDDLEQRIKGQTLTYIFDTFFPGKLEERRQITSMLDSFEQEMDYAYLPGVTDFVADLRRNEVRVAVVTSSNEKKMAAVRRVHPELDGLFDRILTAELFTASKPAPDCFLLGMQVLDATPGTTVVFEDSFNGLKAGMASGATVIGVAGTFHREVIAPMCHRVVDDFSGLTHAVLQGWLSASGHSK